ncbi:MAG: 4Fe-4S binding protein [Polyangia bacterium]|jgi:ferredoxin|nr:4Fe-4S binding protein [Polyangia bacterium]
MGHLTAKNAYRSLQERLNRMSVGAPGEGIIYEILKIVFTPEEAELAARFPMKFATVGALSRRLRIPERELQDKLDRLCDRGVVLDLFLGGKRRYMLNPTVVGFFEFSMMRVREDLDQKHLARLYHEYMLGDPAFFSQFKEGTQTTPFRALVHEEALPEDFTEVLDWERATYLIEEEKSFGVAICHCRHVKHHMGEDCQRFPMEDSCLSMGLGVDYLVRHGMARRVEREEARDLLARSREAGMVHLGDNVQRRPTFICNCCGCCCEVLGGFKRWDFFSNVFASNFLAEPTPSKCRGCKKCAQACPVNAIDMVESVRQVDGRTIKRLAVVDPKACIGCGVCQMACRFDSLKMVGRQERRIAPENTVARVLTMALEQGKLHEILVEPDDSVGHRAAHALLGAVLNLDPTRRLLAQRALKSRFIDALIAGAQKAGMRDAKIE